MDRSQPSTIASVRELIEPTLLFLALFLTFRAFVLEWFVIPTCSMAPTLLGTHFDLRCPRCGHGESLNADLRVQKFPRPSPQVPLLYYPAKDREHPDFLDATAIPLDPVLRSPEEAPRCPNCGYGIPPRQLPGHPEVHRVENGQTRDYEQRTFPWTNNGDRIAVLKSLYFFQEPQRWDVVVFKEPVSAQYHFVKRLVGLPGDTVEIIGGDLFIRGQIARKPLATQRAMYQTVCDLDEFPLQALQASPGEGGYPWSHPWKPQGATAGRWNTDGPVLRYKAGTNRDPGRLAFEAGEFYLRNDGGYNFNEDQAASASRHIVGDVRLEASWLPQEAGDLRVSLGTPENLFQVVLTLDGRVELRRFDPGRKGWLSVVDRPSGVGVLSVGGAVKVAMDNIDHRVLFWVNGQLVLEHQTPWGIDAARQAFQDASEESLPRVEMEVSGSCRLSHLKLQRDLYYTQEGARRARSGRPVILGKDEFFVLGDNSRHSDDGRAWGRVHESLEDLGTPPGVVPRRYLLGKAFLVFWPAGYRPFQGLNWPLVPRVGEMRMIR